MLLLHTLMVLLHTATCTIYNVTPDDTTCHHCHNLQHYLLNTTKYFTSNTQLLFLPGLHHLHTNLIIQNVHNISLIGSTTNGTTPDTVIQCKSSVGIVMNNITLLAMKNMIIQNCTAKYELLETVILVTECSSVQISNIHVYHFMQNKSSLLGINTMGNSLIKQLTCHELKFLYNEKHVAAKQHSILFENCVFIENHIYEYGIYLELAQVSYRVLFRFLNVTVSKLRRNIFLHAKSGPNNNTENEVQIHSSVFANSKIRIKIVNVSVHFKNCQFINCNSIWFITVENSSNMTISQCKFVKVTSDFGHISASNTPSISIQNCTFYGNRKGMLIYAQSTTNSPNTVIIQNTTFSCNTPEHILLGFENIKLILMGRVIFHKTISGSVVVLMRSAILASHYVEFSQNNVNELLTYFCMQTECFYMGIGNNTIVNITRNVVGTLAVSEEKDSYLPCFFQYFGTSNQQTFIIIQSNVRNYWRMRASVKYRSMLYPESELQLIHCFWISQSVFQNIIPLDVNADHILINSSKYFMIGQQSLCYCHKTKTDCYVNELGPLYPGQTITASFVIPIPHVTAEIIAVANTNQTYFTPCLVHRPEQLVQFVGTGCTPLNYTIGFLTDSWCELFLRVPLLSSVEYTVFYIRQRPCPTGFIKISSICECYPIFKLFNIQDCDVNKQAILRPAHSWISVFSQESIYVSKDCPFDYCKAASFYLNLSTPDLQCQFNRSGYLCGHCKQGFSTVFGSSYCQRCSNIYILLIIPIAIAGLLLVLLLFLLNLTVTDGSINAFILYVNIISINSTVFFPHQHTLVSPAYIFISLANLDLGIQTCFYNGMDDYAKVWLQLTFPFYLIFLATLLIITSRYSTTIQRLTANRALPVLATLYLLSYTKILRTVSSVLFFYSSITHLPSQYSTQVWSVDANIPLFGIKFTIIFIACLLLFLILVPFNIVLLFTRALSRFSIVNKFKPLLDAYQGPYKFKFYYWTGLQLTLRAVYFGISSFEKKTNLTTGVTIVVVYSVLSTGCKPFKSNFKNYQEQLLYLNQVIMYTFALSSSQSDMVIAVNVMVLLAAIHISLIIIHHVYSYAFNDAAKNKLRLGMGKIKDIILKIRSTLFARSNIQQFELQNDPAHLNIPNVTYNYHEYQEPVIGSDYCK